MDSNLDFKELLNIADYNKVEAKDEASIKRYSTVLPPPKKMKKNGVQSDGVKRFLEKKKAEEAAKAAEARKLKDKLMELRSQNSKNNKKAKIMASRTKDNDFSKIRLTEDEVISKKKIEQEIQRKHLKDKVERMKCRIELQEKEKLLPRKRKRKSKHGEEEIIHQPVVEEEPPEKSKFKNRDKNSERKPQRPQPPPMSFHELLKVAQVKQYEPVEIPVQKKSEERLLTKKERRIFEQEQELLRRKQERMLQDELEFKPSKSSKNPVVIHVGKDSPNQRRDETQKFKIPKSSASLDKNITIPKIDKTKSSSDKLPKASSSSAHKLPIQNGSKPSQIASSTKYQIMKQNTNHDREKTLKNTFSNGKHPVTKEHSNDRVKTLKNGVPNGKHPITKERSVDLEKPLKNSISNGKHPVSKGQSLQDREKLSKHSLSSNKPLDSKQHTNHDRERPSKSSLEVQKPSQKAIVKNGDKSAFKKPLLAEKTAKKNGVKIAPAVPTVSTDHLKEMEKRIRENLEKEMEERILAKLASLQPPKPPPPPPPKPVQNKPSDKVKSVNGTHSAMNAKISGKPTSVAPRRDGDRPLKPPVSSQKRLGPPPPPKPKPFHPNPYLEPPRRRLEPQRPQKPMKRRIESDDDDEEEDDMSDFIDDGPSQNDEDYSKYIKEIFGYDKNKYIDYDDDDIVETSFVEQMKEETRSAKLGFLEDLEEERKLKEMEKKRKMKMKKK